MWLSKQIRPALSTADADLGVTTIAGDSVGVMTRGEVRTLPVYGPGGYVWMPENGAAVLVVKGGPGGEEHPPHPAFKPQGEDNLLLGGLVNPVDAGADELLLQFILD